MPICSALLSNNDRRVTFMAISLQANGIIGKATAACYARAHPAGRPHSQKVCFLRLTAAGFDGGFP